MNNQNKIIKLQYEKNKLSDDLMDYCIENQRLLTDMENMREEFLHILDTIEDKLSNNDYGNASVKNRNALDYVRKQILILDTDLQISNYEENKIIELLLDRKSIIAQ